jgi:hypothetical protein
VQGGNKKTFWVLVVITDQYTTTMYWSWI